MILLRNIFKNRWMKSSHIFALQHRYLGISTYLASTSVKDTKSFQKFKLKQARMQRDDEIPIYLKAGFRDKVLFNITLVLILFEIIGVIYTLRDLIKRD